MILLSAFLYETSALDKAYASPVEKYGLYAALMVGYGFAIYACYSYWSIGDTLGFVNSCTWVSVCACSPTTSTRGGIAAPCACATG